MSEPHSIPADNEKAWEESDNLVLKENFKKYNDTGALQPEGWTDPHECQRCLVDFCEDHMRQIPTQEKVWEQIEDASIDEHGTPVPAVMEKIIDHFAPKEDRYESITMIIKTRDDGEAWFDVIHDYITQDCDSVELEDGEWTPCHCGMENMGGMGGTLQQCYDYQTNLGQGIQPIDVARVIDFLANPQQAKYVSPEDRVKIIKWARSEIEFEEYFENRTQDEDEDN